MKKTLLLMLALLLVVGGIAQEKKAKKEKTYNEKGEIIKKGWNFGPLPVVGYDADLGFQYGVTCDIFNFGDGSRYPRYNYKFNVEASRYTKGSGVFRFYSDMPYVVKDTKLFFDVTYFYTRVGHHDRIRCGLSSHHCHQRQNCCKYPFHFFILCMRRACLSNTP